MEDPVELTPGSGRRSRLRLRVKPGGRRDRIVGPYGGALKVEVRAAPEKGKANAAVVALLAGALGLPKDAVRIAAGDTSQDKLVEIDVTPADLARRLSAGGISASVCR